MELKVQEFALIHSGAVGADVRELDIHRSISRLNYSHGCAEGSAV